MEGRKARPPQMVPAVGKGKRKGNNISRVPLAHGGSYVPFFLGGSHGGFDSIRGAASEGPKGGGKGKGKATTFPELPLPVKEAASPPSLEALMADLTLFEVASKGPRGGKGKGKATTSPELPLPMEEAAPPSSLEALMTDLTMFEEPLLKDPEEELISRMVSVYGKVVRKKV